MTFAPDFCNEDCSEAQDSGQKAEVSRKSEVHFEGGKKDIQNIPKCRILDVFFLLEKKFHMIAHEMYDKSEYANYA